MFSRLVTCSKKTPSELRAGDVATRCRVPSPNLEIVAETRAPRTIEWSTTAQEGKSRRPRRRGRVRLVVIDEAQIRVTKASSGQLRSHAWPAEARRYRARAPIQ
jgi:hypothetical protein